MASRLEAIRLTWTKWRPRASLPWAAAAFAMLLLAGAATTLGLLDAERFRPPIIAALERATGRNVAFGSIHPSLGLTPSVKLRDLRLANLPGGSRPDMLIVAEAEMAVELLPLLTGRIVLRRLLLQAPDILLETVNGAPNWQFRRPASPQANTTAPAIQRRDDALPEIGTIAIRDARVSFPGAPEGGVAIGRIDASGQGNLTLNGALRWGQLPVTFDAQAGPLARLLGAPGPAWPLRLRAELAGGHLQAQGEMREPRALSAYHFDITGNLPDPASLATLLRQPLPPLGAISLRGRLVGDGTGQPPRAEDLTLTLGPTRLPPMLALSQATLHMPAPDQPAQLSLRGERAGSPFTLDGQIGPLAGALPVALTISHMGASATLHGEVAQPLAGTGARLALGLSKPGMGSLNAMLSEHGAFFADGLELRDIAAQGPLLAGGGALRLGRNPLPRLEGALTLERLDLDAIRAAFTPPAPNGPQATPQAAPLAAPSPPPARADARLIPKLPLNFSWLAQAAADLRLNIATLRLDGLDLLDVQAHAMLADGRARLDPLALTLPGGRLTLRAAADGAQPLPQMQLSLRGDALDSAAFLPVFGITPPFTGLGEIDLDLRGQGADTQAWAASSVGHIGLALTDGRVQQRLLGALLPRDAQGAPAEIAIACFAARFDVLAGIAQVRALYADGSLGRINGQGQISLRDETLALRLNTDLRIQIANTSGLRVRAPVPVTGVLRAPRFEGMGLVGQGLSQIIGNAGPGPITQECGPALSMARAGRTGPVPASLAPPDQPGHAPRPNLNDLLRGVLAR
jgi:AsmA protein